MLKSFYLKLVSFELSFSILIKIVNELVTIEGK